MALRRLARLVRACGCRLALVRTARHGEHDLAERGAHRDRVACRVVAPEDLLGARVLDLLLDRPLEWPRAILRIEACRRDRLERRLVHVEPDVELRQPLLEASQLDA